MIIIRLDRVLADRKMRLNDLAAQVGISNVNLSYLKTGKVKAVRFSTLDAICKAVPIPTNAIGGLNKNNVDILEGIGIAGICVVSAIMKADDPQTETKILLDLAKKLKKQ